MHDIRRIREDPDGFDRAMLKRGLAAQSKGLLALDEKRRELIHKSELARAEQNAASKAAGQAKAKGDEAEFERQRQAIATTKSEFATLDAKSKEADQVMRDALMGLPNITDDDVPEGADEEANVELRKWGEPRQFDFSPREHFEIEGARPLFDFERARAISGARFVILRGALARLHRALGQFMIDTHIEEHGLEEILTPVLVREDALFGTGNLPKFADDLYRTEADHWLIPTAEVPLTNLASGKIIDEDALPMRFCAQTQCFRSEAGSAGRDTAGMLRQHQFEKVEMVTISAPDESEAELERMTGCAETILKKLEIPYRVVVLCTGDIGFSAAKTYDIEVWLPGQDRYREISSCSNCRDFQARRMNARFRDEEGKTRHLHTLNGSGLAVGRALIAVLENGQQADGSIQLPKALAPYLGGKEVLTPDGELV